MGGDDPPRPSPLLSFDPTDRTTAVGTSPLKLVVFNLGDALSAATFEALAAAVSLRTWPEGNLVPVDLALQNEGSPYPDSSRRLGYQPEIEVKPRAPLLDRWYLLGVSSLPRGLAWQEIQLRHRAPDGTTGVRFRPGSEPQVRAVRLCEKADNVQKLIVETSEPVRATRALTEVVLVTHPGRAAPPTCRSLEAGDGSGGIQVDLACDGVDLSAALEVQVGSGLLGLSGAPAVPPVSLSFVPSKLTNISGCRAYPAP